MIYFLNLQTKIVDYDYAVNDYYGNEQTRREHVEPNRQIGEWTARMADGAMESVTYEAGPYGNLAHVIVRQNSYAAPVYTAPAPVYTAPAPVYTAPAPVYTAPAPVYTAPAPVYSAPTYDQEYEVVSLSPVNLSRSIQFQFFFQFQFLRRKSSITTTLSTTITATSNRKGSTLRKTRW